MVELCEMSAIKTTRATWFILALVCLYAGGCHAANMATPALKFVPRPPDESKGNRLIWLTNTTYHKFVNEMNDFIDPYMKRQGQSPSSYYRCSWTSAPDREDKSCAVFVNNKMTGSRCIRELNYGFDVGEPCFFLSLDKLVDWKPEAYTATDTTSTDLPAPVRDSLERSLQQRRQDEHYVWINCAGEFAFDKEWMGPVVYHPMEGLPTFYFPYRQSQMNTYLPPFVTLHLPGLKPGAAVNVVCRAYAKNIQQDVTKSLGATHFQVLADFDPNLKRPVNPSWRSGDAEPEPAWRWPDDTPASGTTLVGSTDPTDITPTENSTSATPTKPKAT